MDPFVSTSPPRRRLPLGRLVAVLGAGALIGLLIYGLVARNPNTTIRQALADGDAVAAPGFELRVLSGADLGPDLQRTVGPELASGSVALEDLRGTPVVLNFWASWCGPCREEAPALDDAWVRAARPEGVLVLGINAQDARSHALDFMRELKIPYPSLIDSGENVARDYGVTGLPETVFIDRDGEVVGHVVGAVDGAQLREGIAAARSGEVIGARAGGPQGDPR